MLNQNAKFKIFFTVIITLIVAMLGLLGYFIYDSTPHYHDDNLKIKKNDIAVIDFEGKIDNKVFEGGTGTDYKLTIGSNSFIAGFEEQLMNHKKGDVVNVKVQFPNNYQQKNLAGKKAVFKTTIKHIVRGQASDNK